MAQPLTRHTVGILGPLGALLLVVWAVGFVVFGAHRSGWHLLVPAGILLVLIQVVLRVTSGGDEPD